MAFFDRLFGKNKQEQPPATIPEATLPWIAPEDNPWGRKLLDLRPISETMLSSSRNPRMAENALSYTNLDGTIFWGIQPENSQTVASDLSFAIDGTLHPGVLFTPTTMEHKWAIYFDGEQLLFIRSWLKEVYVTAATTQRDGRLLVTSITGQFTPDETPEFTIAVLNYLLVSLAFGEVVPAPLPETFASGTRAGGIWAFSTYGNQARIGIFDHTFHPVPNGILRSHSLLHIAVARGRTDEIAQLVQQGIPVTVLAGDGLSTLHWAVAYPDTNALKKLLELGADPDTRTTEGATPLMNAVQSGKRDHIDQLLNAGAAVNAVDNRGFTSLHRAAEMGHTEIVRLLLSNGADKTITAEGYTALSLATAREHAAITDLLTADA